MAAWLNKWLLVSAIPLSFLVAEKKHQPWHSYRVVKTVELHPFHVSVVEINHNVTEKSLEISCKIFTDDFEKALAQNYKTNVDLINPPNKKVMDSLVKKYISSHLSVSVNDKPVVISYIGFEHDNDAILGYYEADNIPSVKKITISNKIMYDFFTDQVNLMHVIVAGNRQSTKLEYPSVEAVLNF